MAFVSRFHEKSSDHVDVEFEVRRDGAFFGTLKVSNGAIVWEPANAKKYEFKLGWRRFDDVAQEYGQAIER